MNTRRALSSALLAGVMGLLAASPLSAQTWSVINLHPAGSVFSYGFATTGTQQGGQAKFGGNWHAAIWAGSAASFVDLDPSGSFSFTYATTGSQQAGYVTIAGFAHAAIWAGSAASFVDLHPAGFSESGLRATTGSQQAGYATIGGTKHAGIWSGSAASFVDLHPLVATESYLRDTTGSQQVGYATIGGNNHAGIWSGSFASFVDLHPPAASASELHATTGSQQAGQATIGGNNHAGIWSGSFASFVDIHPSGYSDSLLNATIGSRQVGTATIGGHDHAGIWSGTAASFFDLHSLLPAGYLDSYANSIWSDGSTIFVVGTAVNGNSLPEATLWKFTPNQAPTLAVNRKPLKPTTKARITLRGTASDPNDGIPRVLVKVGKAKFRPAKVVGESWTFVVKLTLGRNVVKIYALDSAGLRSPTRRFVIIRRP